MGHMKNDLREERLVVEVGVIIRKLIIIVYQLYTKHCVRCFAFFFILT